MTSSRAFAGVHLWVLTALSMLAHSAALGQGTVVFANVGAGVSAPVLLPAEAADGDFMATLLAGPTADAVEPIGPETAVLSNGFFSGGVRVIDSVPPGGVAAVQVLIEGPGVSIRSGLIKVTTGGDGVPPSPPAALVGLESVSLISGVVNFSNVGPGLNAPVVLPEGARDGDFTAQLIGGISVEAMNPIGDPVPVLANGFFSGGTLGIPGVAPGAVAVLKVVVEGKGLSAMSPPLEVVTGGAGVPPSPPASLIGLEPISLRSGTVNFSNIGGGVDAPVILPPGAADGDFVALLLGGPSAEQLVQVGDPVAILANGLFAGGVRTIPGVVPGEVAVVKVVAEGQGLMEMSASLEVTTGGAGLPPSPPAALVGLEPIFLVPPEPMMFESISLNRAGAVTLALSGRKGQTFVIDASRDLVDWETVAGGRAPADQFEITLDGLGDAAALFFKAVTGAVRFKGNLAPQANACLDQTLFDEEGDGTEVAVLNALGSFDLDGEIVSYEWRERDKTIAEGGTVRVELTIGVHTIELIVTDNQGEVDTDTVVVEVNPAPAPEPPRNLAGKVTETGIRLEWSSSESAGVTYKVYRRRASSSFEPIAQGLTDTHYEDKTIRRGEPAFYVVTALDSKGTESRASNEVTITVDPSFNLPPRADAGEDIEVTDLNGDGVEVVELNGDDSEDSDGLITSYEWTEGDEVLGDRKELKAAFSVGTHRVTLTVSDENGVVSTDSIEVIVQPLPKLEPPSELEAEGREKLVLLRWRLEGGSIPNVRFNIYRRTGNAQFRLIIDGVGSRSFRDRNVKRRTNYSYYVTAMDATGTESGRSNIARARTE